MAVTLYAWACPAVFTQSPVDHTWVTAFDNRTHQYDNVNEVIAAGAEYWFCWGDYHARGHSPSIPTGLLGTQDGEPSQARCVARPNASSSNEPEARGTIFLYGVHGVCHQIANQILFTTRTSGKPLTVRRARAYWLSDFFWGTYGTNSGSWRAHAGRCDLPGAKGVAGALREGAVPDLFAQRAASLLADEPQQLSAILGLREEARAEKSAMSFVAADLSAEAINRRHWEVQQEAASNLGEARFRLLFEHEPGQYVELVDPSMHAAQTEERLSGG